ncbi:MAG: rRNA maturation RNase YbeY [Ruminococcaceae bacterium]|nr:rRNA maturation RNase YbeY [Oscillospiraceae bacterium]
MKQKVRIYFSTDDGVETVSYALKHLVRRSVLATLDAEGFRADCQVSVTFTDNAGIRELNRQYRNIDKETDVLSFPLTEFERGEEPPMDAPEVSLGDIVLSLERAVAQAEEYGHSSEREVAFLTVHSMLHLLGYDHVNSEEEELEMRSRQREILGRMGLTLA